MIRALAATGRSLRGLVFYVVLPLVVIGLLLWSFLLPDLVEQAAKAWLAANTRDDIAFTVEHIDLHDATIRDISAADGTITVERVSVEYSPERLRQGFADRMTISGLRWSTRLVDGALDLQPLNNLIPADRPDATEAQDPLALPVPIVEVRDASILVATPGGPIVLPFSGKAETAQNGRVTGDFVIHPRLPFGALSADVSFDADTSSGSADLFIDVSDGWARAPGVSVLGLSGQVALQMSEQDGPSATGYLDFAQMNSPLGDLPGAANFSFSPEEAQLSLNLVTPDGALAFGAAADAALSPRPTVAFSVDIVGLSESAIEKRTFSLVEVGLPPPKLSISGQASVATMDSLLGATSFIDALSAIDADGEIDLGVAGLTVPRLVTALSAEASLAIALTGGAAVVDAEKLSLSAEKFDGQLFGIGPGDLLHAYLADGGTLTFEARDGPALTAIASPDNTIDVSLGGDLLLDLGEVLRLRAGSDRINVVADATTGALSWQSVERGGLVIEQWSGRPFGLALTEARATVEGVGGAFTGTARLKAEGDLAWPGGLVAENSRLNLATDLDFGGDHLTVTLTQRNIASFGAIDVPGETPISIGAIALSADLSRSRPVFDIRFDDDGASFEGALNLAGVNPTMTASPAGQPTATFALEVPPVSIAASGEMNEAVGLDYSARIDGKGGKATISTGQEAAPGLPMAAALDGIGFSVDAGSDAPLAVTFEADRIAHAAPRPLIAPLNLTSNAIVDAGIVQFDTRLREGTGNLVIDISGRHDIARDQGSGTVELFPLLFLEDGLQPGRLLPYFAPRLGVTTGTVSLTGPIAWSDAGVTSDLLLTVEDFSTAFDAVTVAGVNAAITIDRLMPPSTPPSQLVGIAGVDLGLPLTNGLVSMRLDRNGKPLVERSQWQWAGGQVATSMSRAEIAGDADLLVLEIDGIALDQLLELTPQGSNIEATGSLFGRIPVVFRGGAFVIVDGWLESSFEGGEINYSAEELAPGLLAGGEGVGLLLDALDNFQYSRLRVDLSGLPDGQTEMRFRIRGKNPDLYGGAEVEFNMGITGQLEQILRQSYEAYYTVPEEVARRLAGAAKDESGGGQ